MYYKCVKFHKNPISGLGGVALTRYMDGQTDGQGNSYIPPQTLFAGGYNNLICLQYSGMTALHEASQKGHHEVVHILLDYGAKVNALDMVRYLITISFFLSF